MLLKTVGKHDTCSITEINRNSESSMKDNELYMLAQVGPIEKSAKNK